MTTAPAQPNIFVALRLLVSLAFGAAVAWLYVSHAQSFSISDGIAFAVATICVLSASRLFVESMNAKALGQRMQVEGAGTPKEINGARLQALLLLALGIALVWPPLATLYHWPAPVWAYALTAAFILVRIGYTLTMFARGDEFLRQRVKNATWWTYFWGQTALLAYASAQRMGLAPPITAWDIVVWFVALSILMPLFIGRAKTSV